jgi:anti-anti-sigma factor
MDAKITDAKIAILQPEGVLDSKSSKALFCQLNQLLQSNVAYIAIDCRYVPCIDSSGLGSLVRMLKMVQEAGGRFGLCAVSEQTQMMLELTDMQDMFEVFSSQIHFRLMMGQ